MPGRCGGDRLVRLPGLAAASGEHGGPDGGPARCRARGDAGDDEPADRRGAWPVRVRGDDRGAGGEPGAGGAAVQRAAARPPRLAGAYRPGPAARRRAAGASAAAAARGAGARRCRVVRSGSADLPGPGGDVVDAAGRAARRRGPVAAAGRCGHGAAPGAGDREGRQGAHCPGGRGVLRRAGRLPARRTALRVPRGGVLRGAARPDCGPAADRGRAAADLPYPQAGLRGGAGAAAPAAAHLRHRA